MQTALYSLDLRTRVLRDWDAGMKADAIAAKYSVSRAWVHRLRQRRRETGAIAPRRQTRWRTPALTPHVAHLKALIREQPDRTLAALQVALGTAASLATIGLTGPFTPRTIRRAIASWFSSPSQSICL